VVFFKHEDPAVGIFLFDGVAYISALIAGGLFAQEKQTLVSFGNQARILQVLNLRLAIVFPALHFGDVVSFLFALLFLSGSIVLIDIDIHLHVHLQRVLCAEGDVFRGVLEALGQVAAARGEEGQTQKKS
jgi:hypothetical protein